MKPYGAQQEHQLMDRKRRYLNSAMRPGDLREERADKRRERAAGEAEIREAVDVMAAAEDDVPGDGIMRCAPDCPTCGGPCTGIGAPFGESETPAPSSATVPK